MPLLRSLLVLCLVPLTAWAAPPVAAQPAEGEVRAVIDALFDGMRVGDSTAVRQAFHPDAQMLTVMDRGQGPVLRQGSVDGFVQAVGQPHEEVWDEQIYDVRIDVDGAMAQAWTPYTFYLGDRLSHCGVNSFQFAHTEGRWRIVSIIDTRRQDGCPDVR